MIEDLKNKLLLSLKSLQNQGIIDVPKDFLKLSSIFEQFDKPPIDTPPQVSVPLPACAPTSAPTPPPIPPQAQAPSPSPPKVEIAPNPQCSDCPNCANAHSMIEGAGGKEAKIVFVIGMPSKQDLQLGLPLAGESGALLKKIIAAIELNEEDYFVTTIVKCYMSNMPLWHSCLPYCLNFFQKQITQIRPSVIITLGPYATSALIPVPPSQFAQIRGKVSNFHNFPLLPTYHPAQLLKDPSLKRLTWQDMKLVKQRFL